MECVGDIQAAVLGTALAGMFNEISESEKSPFMSICFYDGEVFQDAESAFPYMEIGEIDALLTAFSDPENQGSETALSFNEIKRGCKLDLELIGDFGERVDYHTTDAPIFEEAILRVFESMGVSRHLTAKYLGNVKKRTGLDGRYLSGLRVAALCDPTAEHEPGWAIVTEMLSVEKKRGLFIHGGLQTIEEAILEACEVALNDDGNLN